MSTACEIHFFELSDLRLKVRIEVLLLNNLKKDYKMSSNNNYLSITVMH